MGEVLTNLSDALAAAVETAGAGTVRLETRRRLAATGIVWSADGVIVTANHVVERDDNLKVGLANGQSASAKLVGRDPSTDLAVLRAEGTGLSAPAWADAGSLRVGQLVLALGRAGQSIQATLGIISALGESWRTPVGGKIDRYLQTDVVMYPGFSGGPLVSVTGQVVGLNSSALAQGVSVALPVDTVRGVVETLLKHGRVRRGYLGLSTQPVRLPAGLAESAGQETGLLIVSVEPGSPADKGGLVLGDTVVALAGKPVRHHDDLLALLSGDRIGESIALRLVRGGELAEKQVVVGERNEK